MSPRTGSTDVVSSTRRSLRAEREAEWFELLRAIAAGDQEAMARFYDATHRLVFALVHNLLGASDVAEEVVLDVFMQVWRTAASFDRSRGSVSSWLLTLARSRALDRRRALAMRCARESAWTDELDRDAADCACGSDPVRVQDRSERAEIVRSAIRALPEVQRRAIELAYFPGLSHGDIAERLGEPLGTVKTRIRLAMIKLKDLLETLEQDG